MRGLWTAILFVIAFTTTAPAEQTIAPSLEAFRAQVIATAKTNWQVIDAEPDRSGAAGRIELFLRRAHYPPHGNIDIQVLYEELKSQPEDQRTAGILAFLDRVAFRPLSKRLVAGARPTIMSNLALTQWITARPELSEAGLLAISPLSDDASIIFEHGVGTGSTLLRNYDFEGMSDQQKLNAVRATLDECAPHVIVTHEPDGIDEVTQHNKDYQHCGLAVLSPAFWASVVHRYPDGAYVAFPFDRHPLATLRTLVVSKRLSSAQSLLRSKFQPRSVSSHIYEFRDGRLEVAE